MADGTPLTRREWRVLIALGLPLAVGSINMFGGMLALIDIEADFGSNVDELRWLLLAFLIPDALVLLLSARLGDFTGRRRLMVTGALVFAAAAFASAVAPGYWFLFVTRILEGVGAGLMFGGTLAVVADTVKADRLGRAFGVWGFVGALMFAVSPLLSGLVVHHLGWRWLFVVNGVAALVAALLLVRFLDDDEHRARIPIDPVGVSLLAGGVVALVYGLIRAPGSGWLSGDVIAPLAIGIGLVGALAAYERRSAAPLWSPATVRRPGFLLGTGVMTLIYLAQEMTILITIVYLGYARDFTALEVGALLLTYSMITPLVSPWSGIAADRVGPSRLIVVGLWIATGGALLLALADADIVLLCVGLALLELGLAATRPAANATAMARIPPDERGDASGLNMTARLFGSMVGIAAGASIFLTEHQRALGDELESLGGDRARLDASTLGGLVGEDSAPIDVFGTPTDLRAIVGSTLESAATTTFVALGLLLAAGAVVTQVTRRGAGRRSRLGPAG